MASHGIPRTSTAEALVSDDTRVKEQEKIRVYRELVKVVLEQRANGDRSKAALDNTLKLLSKNPEFYTIWNIRREILLHQFSEVEETQSDESTQSQDEKVAQPSIAQLLEADLMFLYPMLKKSPKCYWIWNHRMWLLEQTTRYLSLETSLGYWRQEFALVGKMLALDNRNFHGWGYRRKVVSAIESLVDMQNTEQGRTKEEMKHSLAKEELDYTTKMIGVNLSNFSAWHNRTTLLVRMLNENEATDAGRRKRLDEELDLIHNALIDPYDQSLWFYHQNLMSTFDPSRAAQTFCPRLTTAERIEYVENEIEEIRDMLDGAETCKWIYIALIEARLLLGRLQEKGLDEDGRGQVLGWVGAVKKLDPLRRNRWIELEEQVDAMR